MFKVRTGPRSDQQDALFKHTVSTGVRGQGKCLKQGSLSHIIIPGTNTIAHVCLQLTKQRAERETSRLIKSNLDC